MREKHISFLSLHKIAFVIYLYNIFRDRLCGKFQNDDEGEDSGPTIMMSCQLKRKARDEAIVNNNNGYEIIMTSMKATTRLLITI